MAKKSKGLGDTIEKVTKATGIQSAVKKVFGDDCGCEERREALNKLFPYNDTSKISDEDVMKWLEFKERFDEKRLLIDDQDLIISIINKLGYSFSECRTCSAEVWRRHIKTIDDFVKNYCV